MKSVTLTPMLFNLLITCSSVEFIMNRNLKTVAQFCADHPAFNQGGIRWLIFNENQNGLTNSSAIIRIGKRVYIGTVRARANERKAAPMENMKSECDRI